MARKQPTIAELRRLGKEAFGGARGVDVAVMQRASSQGDGSFVGHASVSRSARSSYDMNAARGQFSITVQVDGDFEDEVRELLGALLSDLADASENGGACLRAKIDRLTRKRA